MTLFLWLACGPLPDAPSPLDPPAAWDADMVRPHEPVVPDALDESGVFRPLPDAALTDRQRADIQALESLGYVDGEVAAPIDAGVTLGARPGGVKLWWSGHAPEAYLMSDDGTILHTWRRTFAEVFGDGPIRGRVRGTKYWRRTHALPHRGLLAIFEGHGLVRLDQASQVRWSLRKPVHHDLHVYDDGSILVLSREGQVRPELHPRLPVLDDQLLWVSAEGTPLREISLLSALLDSPWRHWIDDLGPQPAGDVLHTNSVDVVREPVPGVPQIQPGQVLVSFRTLHGLAVVDPSTARLVWGARGVWRGQHDAQLLDGGRLLLFDNFGDDDGKGSAVREFDVASMKQVWAHRGFSSPFFGAVQRLTTGNTLITDSWSGRAFEVTPGGDRVWSFVNPHRIRRDGSTYIGVLPMLETLEPLSP